MIRPAIEELVGARPGSHRAPCPHCCKGPSDDAAKVDVMPDGVLLWFCHRCGHGGRLGASAGPRTQRTLGAYQPVERPCWSREAERAWRCAQSLSGEDPVVAYLLARECAVPPADGDARWLPAHSGLLPPGWPDHFDVMLCRVSDAVTAKPTTLHVTFVDRDAKAPIERPKRLWPGLRAKGGVIRLWPDEAVTYGLGVAEGVETALSAAHIFSPVWGCIDAGHLGALPVLAGVESLSIFADPGSVGERKARELEARWHRAGREVEVLMPAGGADWNDVATGMAA